MSRVAIVMLANTADAEIERMTRRALITLRGSEIDHEFYVILVETQSLEFMTEHLYSYPEADVVVHAKSPWGYNKALNAGFEFLPEADFVVIANNDLLFSLGWFSILHREMERYNLDVASPFAPGWEPHEQMVAQAPNCPLFFGTRTSWEVAGWCCCLRRAALDAIRPFDEALRFEWQDVAMVDALVKAGFGRMAMVKDAKVTHLVNASHRLIEDRRGMIEGAHEIYLKRQNGT